MNKKNLTTKETFDLAVQNHKKNNLQAAEKLYKEILKTNPNFAGAYNNLGNVLHELGKHQKAISCYEKAIQIQPNYANAHYNLGLVFKELGEFQKAVSCYEKAVQIQPNFVDAHNNLGAVYFELGEHQKAISCYKKVIQIEPNNLTSHWLSMNTFPIIYENLKEIDLYRKRFEDGTKKINYLLNTQSQYTKKQIVDAMKSSTNFYLSYQGRNDINLQQKYANLIERLTEKIYPQFHQERTINKSKKFIRIGFVSSFFKNHTISILFKNWIIKLVEYLKIN